MFGRKQRRHTVVDTLVGANTKVNGDLNFVGGCHIDGTVKGNVSADSESKRRDDSQRESGRSSYRAKRHEGI